MKTHEPNRLFRPWKLVEASSNSTTRNLLKSPKMWRLLMRVEKSLMVLSLVPEPTWRNIQHLKDYPVFKVFFLDFRTLAVSWATRYASAQRAELRDSCTACARVETSKARVPRKSARTVIPTNYHADELIRGEPQIEKWKMNYDARVWVRPRTNTRVELIRCYTGRPPKVRKKPAEGYQSVIACHLAANEVCRKNFRESDFSILCRCRSKHHQDILEAMFIHEDRLWHKLCKQKFLEPGKHSHKN